MIFGSNAIKKALAGFLAVFPLVPVFDSCGSSATSSAPVPETAFPPSVPLNPFCAGGAGKGRSVAILAPKATGFAENQDYIPGGTIIKTATGYAMQIRITRDTML